MTHAITRGLGAAAGVFALSAALIGCSTPTPTEPTDAPATDEIVQADIVAATGPQLSNVNIYLGQDEGIFEEWGLTVTNEVLTAGPDAVPNLLSGAWQFAMVDTATAIRAAIEGVPVTTVAAQTLGVPGDQGYAAIMVKGDSGIETLADLEGKKLQVNALGGTAEALVRASMIVNGADPDLVQFVEVAPPEAIAALQAGQVDALFLSEPLITVGEGMGLVDIFNPEGDTIPNIPAFIWMASKEYADANPQVVRQFQEAIMESSAVANADHDLVIKVAETSTTVPPELLAQMQRFPLFAEKPVTANDIQVFIDLLVDYAGLDASEAPDPKDVVWQG